MLENTVASSGALAEELRNVVSRAEELLHAIGEDGSEAVNELRGRVYEAVDAAKSRLSDLEEQATGLSKRAASTAEQLIRDNPWAAVGLSVGLGLLLGALLSRSSGGSE